MRNERIMQIVKRNAQYSGILFIGRPIIERIDATLDRIGIRHEHLFSGRHINIFLDEFRPFFAINENAQMPDTMAAIIDQRFIVFRIACGTTDHLEIRPHEVKTRQNHVFLTGQSVSDQIHEGIRVVLDLVVGFFQIMARQNRRIGNRHDFAFVFINDKPGKSAFFACARISLRK